MNEECLFCKIVAGEIPSNVVYENDKVMAFKDINPMMPVHVLVIPKEHHEDITDNISADTLAAMIDGVHQVAKLCDIQNSGFRVITNKGDDACQTVHHVHLHVLGGEQMNDGNPAK